MNKNGDPMSHFSPFPRQVGDEGGSMIPLGHLVYATRRVASFHRVASRCVAAATKDGTPRRDATYTKRRTLALAQPGEGGMRRWLLLTLLAALLVSAPIARAADPPAAQP